MANRPRQSGKPRSALGVPEWLWERLDGNAIFALLMVILGVPALCKSGVEPIWAVGGCTVTFVVYMAARCFLEVFAWKKEEAALNRQSLERLTELLPHLRFPRPESPPPRLEPSPMEELPPPRREGKGSSDA